MNHKNIIAALSMMAAISPAIAAQPEPIPGEGAPADARYYCLRIEPITGSRIEMTRCETRQEWSLLGLDVDKEWAKDGVRVIS